MTRPDPERSPLSRLSAEDQALVFDLSRGELSPSARLAAQRRLEGEPSLQAALRTQQRLGEMLRENLSEPEDARLAERLALRIRDRVAAEESSKRRLERERVAPARSWFSGARGRIRFVLAGLAVHVAVLAWVVFRPATPPAPTPGPVSMRWLPSEERAALRPSDSDTPEPLVPLVAALTLSDDLLERHGLPDLEGEAPLAPTTEVRVAEHPPAVGFEMLGRLRTSVKGRRLGRAGLDAVDTLAAVGRGLEALRALQSADGSFPSSPEATASAAPPEAAAGGPSSLGRTALALLPFLGEGRSSVGERGGPGDATVVRGLAWMRTRLSQGQAPSADDLALSLLALSEDYMLAYGRFTPAEARLRGAEIQTLSERLTALQRPDGTFAAQETVATRALWPLLALDAAAHTGIVSRSEESVARLERWFERLPRASEGVPAGADGRVDLLLTAGEMLLVRAPSVPAEAVSAQPVSSSVLLAHGPEVASRPLTGLVAGIALYRRDARAFRAFNRTHGADLLAHLGPAGVVAVGDAVTDTALLLLTLQAAYRTY